MSKPRYDPKIVDMDDLYRNWSSVYDLFYPDRATEAGFWARQVPACRQGKGRVLDLMCGTAEVSQGLANLGHHVLGVDLSSAMLGVGAERLARSGRSKSHTGTVFLAQGDACHLPVLNGCFDLALVGGSGSFNHLDESAARSALQELARVLRPGGLLGMDLVNPYLLDKLPRERCFGPLRGSQPGAWVEMTVRQDFDRERGLVRIHQVTVVEGDGPCRNWEEGFNLYAREPESVEALLVGAGFENVRFAGDHGRAAFNRWSADLVVMATSVAIVQP